MDHLLSSDGPILNRCLGRVKQKKRRKQDENSRKPTVLRRTDGRHMLNQSAQCRATLKFDLTALILTIKCVVV